VSLGTAIYRWPLEVATKIAVAELSKSEFDKTLMYVADIQKKAAYEQALEDCDRFWVL
jgi:hypothetical protein